MPDWIGGKASEADHTVANAVELALDVAYHDGEPRDLAVAAEAWSLLGFSDGSIDISHTSAAEGLAAIVTARRGRPRRLLRADARGMLTAFYILAEAGQINGLDLREAARLRWVARGGHSGPQASEEETP